MIFLWGCGESSDYGMILLTFFKCSLNFSVKLITMDVFWELLKGCLFVFSWLWIWFDWLDPYLPNNKQVRKQSLNSKFIYLFYLGMCQKYTLVGIQDHAEECVF